MDSSNLSIKNILVSVVSFASVLTALLYSLYLFDVYTLITLKICLAICFLIFVVLPIAFKFSYTMQRKVVFLNFVNFSNDYERPGDYGLNNSKNVYLTSNDGVKLGVWQILAENTTERDVTDENFDKLFDNGEDVIVYCHGNAGSRVTRHRIELYQVLRKHFHVVAFDYRGYGDSSGMKPNELGVINDSMFIYQWVANRTNSRIFLWGHSLGTSIGTHALLNLQDAADARRPSGVFLEAPFNNFKEEIGEFPLAKIFRHLPWFDFTVVDPIVSHFSFETDKYVCQLMVPILILHAKDDRVVPYRLGQKLYKSAQKCRNDNQGKIYFHGFDGDHGYGHKWICRAPDLSKIIRYYVRAASRAYQLGNGALNVALRSLAGESDQSRWLYRKRKNANDPFVFKVHHSSRTKRVAEKDEDARLEKLVLVTLISIL